MYKTKYVIDTNNLKHEKKTVRGNLRLKPTLHKMFKEIALKKKTTMTELIERYIIKEYEKLER